MGNEAVANWVQGILDAKGWNASNLAKASGLAVSTVSRVSQPDYPFTVTLRTVALIAGCSGIAASPDVEALLREAAKRPVRPRAAVPPNPDSGPATQGMPEPCAEVPTPIRASQPDTVPMRSFDFIPARLNAAKRGEVHVPRPATLWGIEGAFAFHPDTDALAPAARTRDLLYAVPACRLIQGDMLLLITHEGRVHLGYLDSFNGKDYALLQTGGVSRVPAGQVKEIAEVVLVSRSSGLAAAYGNRAA